MVHKALAPSDLIEAVGHDLGTSPWRMISQNQVDLFAEATDDGQWIHVDPEQAATGPFGGTVAHGYLTLSLLPAMTRDVLEIADRRMTVNYGIERIRFTAPVPVGARLRLHAKLLAAEPRGTGVKTRIAVEVEIEGSDKPALVGEVLSLIYGGADIPVE